jgi:hypothetical protein
MSLIRPVLDQSPVALLREVLVIAAIVVVATLATLLFSGPGAGVAFDTRLDQLALPF